MLFRLFVWLLVSSAFVGPVWAQEWSQLYDEVEQLAIKGKYKEAFELNEKALLQAEKEFSAEHLNMGNTLIRKGYLLQKLSAFADAEKVMLRGSAMIRKAEGEQHEDYALSLANLGSLYRQTNQYEKAIRVLSTSVGLTEKKLGRNNEQFASTYLNLGALHMQMGNYPAALTCIKEVQQIRRKLFPLTHPKYIEVLSNLGSLYDLMDEYVQAETFLEEATKLRREQLGVKHQAYWYSVQNLARLQYRLGNTERALLLDRELVQLVAANAPGHEVHVAALNALIVDYLQLDDYARADSVAGEALVALDLKLGKSSRYYGSILNNLAGVYMKSGRLREAETTLRKASDAYQQVARVDNNTMLSIYRRHGEIYAQMGRTGQADSAYALAQKTAAGLVGTKSVGYAEMLLSKAISAYALGQPTEAFDLTRQYNEIIQETLVANFLYWTAQQRQNYLKRWLTAYHFAFNTATIQSDKPDARRLFYDQTLYLKNLLLAEQTQFKRAIRQQASTPLKAQYDSLVAVRTTLNGQLAKPLAQQRGIDSLENRAETLEKAIARQSAVFRHAQQSLTIRWQDVRNALRPGEAAVEFVSFPYHNGRQLTDSVRYIALVLRPGDTAPALVPLLTHEAPLRQLLSRRPGTAGGGAMYVQRGSEVESDQLSRGDSLYRLIWQPLESLLNRSRRVFVSPGGLLHQVAFAALPCKLASGQSALLLDRYDLRLVGNTRAVVERSETHLPSKATAVLVGGIDYGQSSVTESTNTMRVRFDSLPGTAREVGRIHQLWNGRATTITGTAATEARLTSFSEQAPSVLHLATHGYYQPLATVKAGISLTTDPLLRTGLALASANKNGASSTADDGVLTAYEVANLDLSGLQLAVLSACETGLGDIQGSEGVFGLQRAFRMAGAKQVVVSLWSVPDGPTSVFMETFYRFLVKGKPIHEAFRRTQQVLRRDYDSSVWAAFVLVQ